MAGQKQFSIRQNAKLNGVPKTIYANVVCEESELDSLLATLEGEYVVMGEVRKGGSDADVKSYNLLERVTYRADGKKNISGAIFANNGGLVMKENTTVDSLTAIVSELHPFIDDPSLKPDYNTVKPLLKSGARIIESK